MSDTDSDVDYQVGGVNRRLPVDAVVQAQVDTDKPAVIKKRTDVPDVSLALAVCSFPVPIPLLHASTIPP